jgi:hypothetical protein
LEKSASNQDTSIRPVDIGRMHQVFRQGRSAKLRQERAKKERERYEQLCGPVEERSMRLEEMERFGLVARDEEGRLYVPKKT